MSVCSTFHLKLTPTGPAFDLATAANPFLVAFLERLTLPKADHRHLSFAQTVLRHRGGITLPFIEFATQESAFYSRSIYCSIR
jgi:hypothetical protein